MTEEELKILRLLHACTTALEGLLASPDLNLESLEDDTRIAIDRAKRAMQAVNAFRWAAHCVVCGERIPDVQFTEEERGTLVAYAHRACAERAEQVREHPPATDPSVS